MQSAELLPTISRDELMKCQRDDPVIGQVIRLKETNNALTSDVRRGVNGLTRKLLHEWEKLHLKGGLLYRETSQRSQLVLPNQYRALVLRHLHDDMGTKRVQEGLGSS